MTGHWRFPYSHAPPVGIPNTSSAAPRPYDGRVHLVHHRDELDGVWLPFSSTARVLPQPLDRGGIAYRRCGRLWALVAIAISFVPMEAAAQVRAQARRKAPPQAVPEVRRLEGSGLGVVGRRKVPPRAVPEDQRQALPESQRAQDDVLVGTARQTLERRVQAQLDFVRRACAPTTEQTAAVRAAGERLVAGRMDEIAKWVKVTHQLPESVLPAIGSPDRVLDQEFESALDAALDGERAAKLDRERLAVDERLAQARFHNWVATVDKKLFLSTLQREELLRVLAAHWRRSKQPPSRYTAIFNGDTLLFQRVETGSAAVSRALPELPDANWTVILSAAQRAAWTESQQPRPFVQRRPVPLAVAAPVKEMNAGAEVDDAEEEAAGPARPVGPLRQPQPPRAAMIAMADGARVQAAGMTAHYQVEVPQLASFLMLVLDDLNAAAGLSKAQRHKLELAGKLDVERYQQRLAALNVKLASEQQAGRGVRFAPEEMALVTSPSTAITDDSSKFRKLLTRVLSQEQAQQVAAVETARREFADETARQSVVAMIAERIPLTDAHWLELSAPLCERCEALAGGSFDAREIAARVPADLLRPLFDEAQWELVGTLFGPRREVSP